MWRLSSLQPAAGWPAAAGAVKKREAKSVPIAELPEVRPGWLRFFGRETVKRGLLWQAVAVVPRVPAVSLADRRKWWPGGLDASCGEGANPYTATAGMNMPDACSRPRALGRVHF